MCHLGIIGSTRGTGMLALIDAISKNKLHASIDLVISNKPDSLILERARAHHLQAQYVDPKSCLSRDEYDAKISSLLRTHQIDLIVLIGYMRILTNSFVSEWRNKIINVHPSLLPDFAGSMDEDVHRAVLDSGMKETGCTVHYVTEEVDGGPILIQKKCVVTSGDTYESLKTRVQLLEGEALIDAINLLCATKKTKDFYATK